MVEMFSRPARSSALRLTLGRASLVLLVLALWVANAPATAPAQAAPAGQEETPANMRFYLEVPLPTKFCVGSHYPISVTPRAEVQGARAGGRFTSRERSVTGVQVNAEISDRNIATIDPPRRTSNAIERYGEPLETDAVTFDLHAIKAGRTNLYLTAQVPARYSGGTPRYFGPRGDPVGLTILIQDCEYLVTATYTWELSGTGFRYWNHGSLRARIKASDPEYYGGDGLFAFFLYHRDLVCSERLTYDYPTHVTARRNFTTDELELTFSMNSSGAPSQSCANTYLLSNSPFTDPAAPWRGVPSKFPVAGGTKRIRLVADSPPPQPTGWVTITVQPIVAGGG